MRRVVSRGPLHPQGFNYLLTLGLWGFSFFYFFFFPLSYLEFLAGHPETMGQHPGCEATTVESSWRRGGTDTHNDDKTSLEVPSACHLLQPGSRDLPGAEPG